MRSVAAVKNLASGLALALLGAATLWATAGLATDASAAADPALLPRAVAVGLILVGLGIAVGDALRRRRGLVIEEDAEGIPLDLPVDVPDELLQQQEDETAGPTDWRQVAILVAAIVVYALVAFRLGFVTSTVTFIVGMSLLLGRARYPRALIGLAIFAVAVSAGFYFAFFELLNVRQPITPLL